jgi:hypothetical protein
MLLIRPIRARPGHGPSPVFTDELALAGGSLLRALPADAFAAVSAA